MLPESHNFLYIDHAMGVLDTMYFLPMSSTFTTSILDVKRMPFTEQELNKSHE